MKNLELDFVPQRPKDFDPYWEMIDKRRNPDREAFDLIIASILATRGIEPRVPATKHWDDTTTKTMKAIEACRDLFGTLLQKVSHKRVAAIGVHPKAPRFQLRQKAARTLLFRVEGDNLLWQDYSSIDPERVTLIGGRRCVTVEMPWFTREVNTAFLRAFVQPDMNNGLAEHVYMAAWDNPELLPKGAESVGNSLTEDFLRDLQHWSAKAGFLCVWTRSETGITLLAPSTFEEGLGMRFEDWWANLTLRIFRKYKLPQVVPYMKITDPSTGIVSHTLGKDLTLARERASRPGMQHD